MSTSRGSGAGNGGAVQPIPAGSRKVVQSLKEIVNCPEAEIYAALKECNMDPNEAVNRLLCQDPFHEVKSKREKKKEGKDQTESRSRGANSSSNRGNKTGADRQYGRGSSAQFSTSDSSLFGKTTYKKENGSGPYSSSLSSVHGGSGNSKSRGPPGHSDDASAESKGSFQGTADVWPSVSQPAWVGTPGQVSMADIVRMGRPNKKGSNAPNEPHHNIQDPFVNESLHKDHASKVNQAEVPLVQHVATSDDWPSIEKPAAPSVIPFSEHPVDTELHPEASRVSYDNANYEAEEIQEEEDDDNFESSGGNDDGSVSISSRRMIPEDVSRGASQFDNELYKNMGTYESEAQDFERHEVDEVGSSIISITRNLRQLSVNKDDGEFPSEANAPSVVIPEHLQVHTADCSHLTFGSFGSAMNDAYSSGTTTSFLEKPNLEEAQNETEESTGGQPETRHSEYYVDDSLRSTLDDSLLHRNSATVGSYNASSAPQPEELRPESANVAHGNQYPFPSSDSGYSFDDAQRLNAAFNRTSSQMQSSAPFSNVMDKLDFSLEPSLLNKRMNLVKIMVESFYFMCSVQFWRMALLWTLSLIFSYWDLFTQRFMASKLKLYPRCSPEGSAIFNLPVGKPVCIITGATSGLGAAAAYALSKEGFYVVLVGRSSERLSRAISAVKSGNQDSCLKAFEVDLSSFKSIIQFKHSLEQWLLDSKMHSSVQLLINNAGILATSRRLTAEGYDEMLVTNYIGAFCLTKILLPLLQNSPVPSRVVNLTSFTHRNVCCMQANRETISGKSFVKSKSYPYAQIYEYSKLCMLLFSYELHTQVGLMEKSQHISVIAVDPGAVETNIMREIPSCLSRMALLGLKLLGLLQSSEIGVGSLVDAALVSPEVSGVYFFGGNGRCLESSRLSYDSTLAKDLWVTSCNLFQELVLNF